MSTAKLADVSKPLTIGSVCLPNRVFLAPMSGVTDTPFRALAQRLGAGAVVSEMVASSEWVRGKRKAVAKAALSETRPFILQLAGREPHWMREAAKLAEANGVDIIDINMGCPAREVTGMLSGSALMRDLDHASALIEAVVGAVDVPVTLKMRLGWDDTQRNAPELAQRAEAIGVQLVTVHGRTRCQFYKGQADWSAIAEVKAAISIPLVANGDIVSAADARQALRASGADAVMIGRGAYGAPWLPGLIARSFATGQDLPDPEPETQIEIIGDLAGRIVDRYGETHGVRLTRKHLAWMLDRLPLSAIARKSARKRLCTAVELSVVQRELAALAEALSLPRSVAA